MIYFITQEEKYVKIGIANDPQERLKTLQIGNPNDLRLMVAYPGGKEEESWFHWRCKAFHIRGEWFRLTDGLIHYLSEWLLCKDFDELVERTRDWPLHTEEEET